MPLILMLGSQRQVNLYEFQACLVHVVRPCSKPANQSIINQSTNQSTYQHDIVPLQNLKNTFLVAAERVDSVPPKKDNQIDSDSKGQRSLRNLDSSCLGSLGVNLVIHAQFCQPTAAELTSKNFQLYKRKSIQYAMAPAKRNPPGWLVLDMV